jgi:hypothetical protein
MDYEISDYNKMLFPNGIDTAKRISIEIGYIPLLDANTQSPVDNVSFLKPDTEMETSEFTYISTVRDREGNEYRIFLYAHTLVIESKQTGGYVIKSPIDMIRLACYYGLDNPKRFET